MNGTPEYMCTVINSKGQHFTNSFHQIKTCNHLLVLFMFKGFESWTTEKRVGRLPDTYESQARCRIEKSKFAQVDQRTRNGHGDD